MHYAKVRIVNNNFKVIDGYLQACSSAVSFTKIFFDKFVLLIKRFVNSFSGRRNLS